MTKNRKSNSSQSNHTIHNLKTIKSDLNKCIDDLLRISTMPQDCSIPKAFETQQEIVKLLEKFQFLNEKLHSSGTAKEPVAEGRNSGTTVAKFEKWARENGAEMYDCEICEFPGYDLGLRAIKAIRKSDLVIKVPKKLIMSVDGQGSDQEILGSMVRTDPILKNMPNVALAIFLLYEKFKGDTFWQPYIDILPRSYNTVLYFSIEELQELWGSPTLEMALKQIKCIVRQFAYFYKKFSTGNDSVSTILKEKFNFNEYRWAVSTVMTRQNTIPFENVSTTLIPLWDLCNHANGSITTVYNPDLMCSECFAMRNFEPAEQLFICYGPRSNANLFIHNGFIVENNDFDTYTMKLGLGKMDPLQERRKILLEKLQIPFSGEFSITNQSNPIPSDLMAFLRVFNMSEEKLKYWSESETYECLLVPCVQLFLVPDGESTLLTDNIRNIDMDLERKSMVFLLTRLRLLLTAYKTSVDGDEKFLLQVKDPTVPTNRLLAIRLRTTEKRLICNTIKYLEALITPNP